MALTLNNFCGFETGGLEEASSIVGSPDATEATVVKSGARSLLMAAEADEYHFKLFEPGTSDAGNSYIIGFSIQWAGITLASPPFFSIREDGTNEVLRLDLLSSLGDGKIRLVDATGFGVDEGRVKVFSPNIWQRIEVRFEAAASGDATVWIDGVERLTATNEDFIDTAITSDATIVFLGNDSHDYYIDDVYILSGSTSKSDRLGPAEVFKYQSVKNSTTPDDGGTTLNAGTWNRAGETPLASTATNPEYDTTGAGAVDSNSTNGSPEGPLNDSRIQGEIKGMKGISNMKRSGGGATAHFILMGNDTDGTTRSADIDPTQSFANYLFVSEAASIVPTASEYCRMGFEMDNAQDYECQEQWAMLLHVPATIAELGIRNPASSAGAKTMIVR